MNVGSPHEISQAKYLNFNAYTATKRDPWQRNCIFMLNMCSLSKSPKVALNFSKNASKSFSKGDWCSIKSVNQTRVMPKNKMPMNPIWIGPIGYQWGWSRMTKCIWLTKPWNFECVLSNLSSRLIFVTPLVTVVLLKCIQRRSKLDWFANEQQFTKCVIFMFKILKDNKDFFHGCGHEHHEIWHLQEVGNPQL